MTTARQGDSMRSIAGIWLGVATTFAGNAWDAQWHAAGGTDAGGVPPPHLLIVLGIAILFASAERGRRDADGRVRTYLTALALASGVAFAGQAGDVILHAAGVEGTANGLAHLAGSLGFLGALFVAVMATVAAVTASRGEPTS